MKLPRPGGTVSPHSVQLELPAVHAAVRVARQVVRTFARMDGMPDREVDTLVLVTSELLGNAVDHGGGNSAMHEEELDGGVSMRLGLVVSGTRWTLEVTDEGGGDPEEIQALFEPDGMPDLEDERGRGFYLMAQLVDRMQVGRSEAGNGLVITATREYGAG